MELTVIAAVVIGGMALTGGEGYLIGGLFGVLITALIQTLIQFNGQLSSWWTSIVIGALMLVFIGVQSLLVSWNARQLTAGRSGSAGAGPSAARARRRSRRRRQALVGAAGVIAIVVTMQVIGVLNPAQGQGGARLPRCQLKPFRADQAAALIKAGAVVTYERNGGGTASTSSTRSTPTVGSTADNGTQTVHKTVTPADVDALLGGINDLGWFTDDMYTTTHTPVRQCFAYFTTVVHQGHDKTVRRGRRRDGRPGRLLAHDGQAVGILPPFGPSPS